MMFAVAMLLGSQHVISNLKISLLAEKIFNICQQYTQQETEKEEKEEKGKGDEEEEGGGE